jgi:hypothetical protein
MLDFPRIEERRENFESNNLIEDSTLSIQAHLTSLKESITTAARLLNNKKFQLGYS